MSMMYVFPALSSFLMSSIGPCEDIYCIVRVDPEHYPSLCVCLTLKSVLTEMLKGDREATNVLRASCSASIFQGSQ